MDKKRKTLSETLTSDQLKVRAQEPARFLAQLAVPIFTHLRESDSSLVQSNTEDLAERAVVMAERLYDASLKHATAKLAAQPDLSSHPSTNPNDYPIVRR